MSKTCIALACAVGLLTAVPATAQEKWHPSKWGADDQIGAANLLTPQKVLEAAKLVKTGKTYPLGIVVGRDTPAFPPRSLAVTVLSPNQYQGATLAENRMSYNDDMITGWLGVGTQIDGLGHLGIDNIYYNGNQAKDFVKVTGLEKLGIEQVPPIVTRGVLIDMAKHKGVEMMTEGQIISAGDVKAAMQAQSVTVGKGDVVVLHTGWLSMLAQDPKRFGGGEPGIEIAAAQRPLVAPVGAQLLVHERRAVGQRRLHVGHDRQRVVVDEHLRRRVDHRVAVVADHQRDRVADVVHLVLGQRPVRRVVDLDPRRHPGHRQRRREVEVVPREHGAHARVLARSGRVDGQDLRVRLGRAHERRPQLPGDVDVVDVARAAHDQPRVLLALDRPADPRLGHGGGHASAAASTALTMLW